MTWWQRPFRLVRPSPDLDVRDEVRFHLESRSGELEGEGLSPEAAKARALEEFGDVQRVRRELVSIDTRIAARRRRGEQWDLLGREVRQAARRLLRHPGFALPSLLSLAIGIGGTAALFTVLHQVVLAPLPYPEPDRLVSIRSAVPGVGPANWGLAKAQFLYFERDARSFEALALYRLERVPVGTVDEARVAMVALTSSGMTAVLGASMARGRPLQVDDGLDQAAPVVILSHRFWREQLDGDETILGKTVSVNGAPRTVVGVLGPEVKLPEALASTEGGLIELWLPLPLDPSEQPRNNHVYRALGRLTHAATLQSALADLGRLSAGLPRVIPEAYSASFMEETGFRPHLETLREDVLGGLGRVVWILFGASLLVLMVACANVANLFLARHETRRQELTVRAALGAGSGSLMRYLLSEALLLAGLAAAGGAALAWAGLRLLVAVSPPGLPRLAEVHLAWPTVVAALLVAPLAGAILGLVPMARFSGGLPSLAESGRGTPAPRRAALRRALVVAQVALSLVLVAGAGLLIRSFSGLLAVPTGIEPREVLTFEAALPFARYQTPAASATFYRRMLERLEAVPGLDGAAVTTALPVTGYDGCSSMVPLEAGLDSQGQPPCMPLVMVSEKYFQVMGIPLRGSPPERTPEQRATVTVSEAFARRFWPRAEPIGRQLAQWWNADPERVTAVAGDVRLTSLDRPVSEVVYFPIEPLQFHTPWLSTYIRVVLKAPGATVASHGPLIRRAVAELDSEVPVINLRPMEEVIAGSVSRQTFAMVLLGVAAGAALVLSLVGLYGVVSYLVTQRRLELSIRMALGARADRVGRLVVWQSVRLATLGVALGLGAAFGLMRVLESQLFGVSATDPATLLSVALLLVLLAAAASWLPARRAMRTEPIRALRGS